MGMLSEEKKEKKKESNVEKNLDRNERRIKRIARRGSGCVIKRRYGIRSGFRPARINEVRTRSNSHCSKKCTAQRRCTAWVRRSSDGMCFMSRQKGKIRFRRNRKRTA